MRMLLAMPGNGELGRAIAERMGAAYAEVETRRFADGESLVRLPPEVSEKEVDLLCTLAQPDPQFLSLAFAVRTARDLGARSVRLIAPYLAYMRQDIRFRPGEAVSARHFARMLSELFDAVITVDPHLHRISALAEVFSIPAQALSVAALMGDWIKRSVTNAVVVGPDQESEQWASAVALAAGAPYALLSKTRRDDGSIVIEAPDLSRWRGLKPVLVDDIASTGGTLVEAAEKLAAAGFSKPACVVVHALCGEAGEARIRAAMDGFVSTDTVPHPSNAISVAKLIADALTSV